MGDNSKNWILFLVFIFFSLLLIWLDQHKYLSLLWKITDSVVVPIERPIYQTKTKIISTFLFVNYWQQGQEKIARLEEENRLLSASVSKLDACQKENGDIRRLLGAPLPSTWQFLPARVVGYVDGELFIDKGKRDGLSEGMTVVYENTLVGKIISLQDFSSKVVTPVNNDFRIPIKIKNLTNNKEMAIGLLYSTNGKVIFDQVLQEEKILLNDYIYTSGEADFIPDLPIGKISNIEKNESSIFQKGLVELMLDYQQLSTVFIVYRK